MKIALVGGSYQQRSLPFDAQRTVNLFAVSDPQGADVAALYGTPGKSLFATAGSGGCRECFASANGRAFMVSGNSLYEVFADKTTTLRGNLDVGNGIVTIEENGFDLGICDGNSVYMFTYATNAFNKITDPDLPPAGAIDFIDGYFVINAKDTGKFYISDLYNGASWNALNFASAESSPDLLSRAVNFVGQLGLFGAKTLEIWRNTGDSTFPFTRISGATPVGSVAPYTILSIDTSVFWVGNNEQGTGIVYKAQGFNPARISTDPIEKLLQKVPDQSRLKAWTYQQEGHVFYVITGAGLETSLVYDLATGLWHERAFLNGFGQYEPDLGFCCMYAFGKHLVGDRRNGKIYEMSQDIFTDDGSPILRKRVYTHLTNELQPTRYSELQIGFEAGVGLQFGNGSDPVCYLRISKDGGRTWGDYWSAPIGKVGNFQQQVKFRRLGIAQIMTFEVSISDPVKIAITGSYLQ